MVEQQDDSIRIIRDNRRAPNDRFQFGFFLPFWMAWVPPTLFFTALLFVPGSPGWFLLVWCVAGWAGTIGVPLAFVQRTWTESITLDAVGILLEKRGWLASRPIRIPFEQIQSIALGGYNDGSDHGMGRKFPSTCFTSILAGGLPNVSWSGFG